MSISSVCLAAGVTITIPLVWLLIGVAAIGAALAASKAVPLRWLGGAVFLGVLTLGQPGPGLPDWLPLAFLAGAVLCVLGFIDAVRAAFKRKG